MSTEERTDETDNNLVATGALFMALHVANHDVEVVSADGMATNQLDVRFAFMQSPYRITVERVRDEESVPS